MTAFVRINYGSDLTSKATIDKAEGIGGVETAANVRGLLAMRFVDFSCMKQTLLRQKNADQGKGIRSANSVPTA